MKFGILHFKRAGIINLGDDLQILAVRNLYRHMNIPDNEIVQVEYSQLGTYDGEYIVLPICFPMHGYYDGKHITCFSDRIIPVFISLSIMNVRLSNEETAYLKKYEPIGCRDEHTLRGLRKLGIEAYLNGCITATFPRRDKSIAGDKVYLVDLEQDIKDNIPGEIFENSEEITQLYDNGATASDAEDVMRELYEKYKKYAKLVITSRMHCAVPCAAAGIPVVLVNDYCSYRYSWLENIVHFYNSRDFKNITWENIKAAEYEDIKEKILDFNGRRLRETFDKYSAMTDISYFWENRDRNPYYVDSFDRAVHFIEKTWSREDSFTYSLWGMTQLMDLLYDYLSENYPNSRLANIYDIKFKGEKHGVKIASPVEGKFAEDEFVFVCVARGCAMAEEMFGKIGKKNYFLCWERI